MNQKSLLLLAIPFGLFIATAFGWYLNITAINVDLKKQEIINQALKQKMLDELEEEFYDDLYEHGFTDGKFESDSRDSSLVRWNNIIKETVIENYKYTRKKILEAGTDDGLTPFERYFNK